jgi:hypothetical protein
VFECPLLTSSVFHIVFPVDPPISPFNRRSLLNIHAHRPVSCPLYPFGWDLPNCNKWQHNSKCSSRFMTSERAMCVMRIQYLTNVKCSAFPPEMRKRIYHQGFLVVFVGFSFSNKAHRLQLEVFCQRSRFSDARFIAQHSLSTILTVKNLLIFRIGWE